MRFRPPRLHSKTLSQESKSKLRGCVRPWSSVPGQAGLPSPNERLEPTGFEEGNQGKEVESTVRKLVINSHTVGRGRTSLHPPRVGTTRLHYQ